MQAIWKMTNLNIVLTATKIDDLSTFFQFQLDRDANYLAAFTAKDPNDKTAYLQKYSKHLADPTIRMCTIKIDDVIVGSIAKFMIQEEAGITYWIDREYWGRGIASAALNDFLKLEQARPIHASTAFDNYGSQRVLEKAGFVRVGTEKGFANARQSEIEEYLYKLSD